MSEPTAPRPPDVPDEMHDAFLEAFKDAFRQDELVGDAMRAALAAVVPEIERQVREHDAATVAALCPDPHTEYLGDHCPYWHAAAILRGESR